MNNLCVSFVIKPDENPMFTAVSSLSPVSIQTLIPAYLKLYKASGTPSYRLSYTAVEPRTFKSYSIILATFSIFRYLSGPWILRALWYFSSQSSYCASVSLFSQTKRVLNPSVACSDKLWAVRSLISCYSLPSGVFRSIWERSSDRTESAPFVSTLILPSGSLIMTDIRFLEEVNSIIFRISIDSALCGALRVLLRCKNWF